MFFSKIIAYAALALTPFVSAQTLLQFTSVPGPFTIGKASVITWTGGSSGESVTLILRQGTNPSNLNTVAIIASNVNGSSYAWTPSDSLKPANDYALQITQGLDGNNYSGLFSIQSAAAGAATTIFAVAGSSTVAVATITPNMTSAANMTSTGMMMSGTGTGSPLPRNTTMVSATLSTTATITATSTTTSGAASSSSTTGGAIAAASAKAVMGLGAVAAAAMYLL